MRTQVWWRWVVWGLCLGMALPAAAEPAREGHICFAISAMISPQRTFSAYRDLLDYLGERLGRRVELKQRRTYQEVNDLFAAGEVDCGLLCTGAYIHGDQHLRSGVVAVPVVGGQQSYRSYLIVAKESPYRSLDDLRNKVFAFTDDLSNTGTLYPHYLLAKRGAAADTFFAYTFYTHSHDKSVQAVARGIADGAAVDSLVYDSLVSLGDATAAATRVIQRSPPFGIPPVVVSPRVAPQLRARLRDILLTLHEEPRGKAILAALQIDRFAPPTPGLYASVEEMEAFVAGRTAALRTAMGP